MTRVDETEVITSTHIADTQGGVESSNSKSPAYTDTEVNSTERSVRFWNTAHISDTSNGKVRKFRAKILIEGHGVNTSSGWAEFEYTSPLLPTPVSPSKTFNVPDHNLSQYNFDVRTIWELFKQVGESYSEINSGGTAQHTATVNDTTVED